MTPWAEDGSAGDDTADGSAWFSPAMTELTVWGAQQISGPIKEGRKHVRHSGRLSDHHAWHVLGEGRCIYLLPCKRGSAFTRNFKGVTLTKSI